MIGFLVSIIVPIFNSEVYLAKCIESVINQTYENIEIILVNDGSTDTTPKIIDEYANSDKRIIAVHKENGGIGSAYKAALSKITGDYIFFVDSDDWLELEAVEDLINLAVENDADMVSFGIRAYNQNGEVTEMPIFRNSDLVLKTNAEILQTHFEVLKHPTLARLYKRKLFENIVIFEQNIGIDEMLTPQLLTKCNTAVYISKEYYNVLIRQESVCREKHNEKTIKETLLIHSFVCEFIENRMPEYAIYPQLKYLNILIIFYRYLEKNVNLINNETKKQILKDIRHYYEKVLDKKLYKEQGFIQKLYTRLIITSPIIYGLLLKLKSKDYIY